MSNPELNVSEADISKRIQALFLRDRRALQNQWRGIEQRQKEGKPVDKALPKFTARLEKAEQQVAHKAKAKPTVTFPESLPIAAKKAEIAELIEKHQVVVLAGETGSGKTTQLPKICLDIGRGFWGKIGHTQPRRIAASTVAARVAEELNTPLGDVVGYQVRFTDESTSSSYIKLMTDGILLAEIQNDPLLLQYDTLIIDEAHERSLNIDFLLGYIKRILPKRPDLKVIVTSATIDLERFSKHFDNAPIIEVSGRTFPVDIQYRPNDEEGDLTEQIVNAVAEVLTLPNTGAQDILVFLSGERDIREAAKALRQAQFKHLEVLPLYARLSIAEQKRVFAPHKGRRVVLATNVAETSITVPGIGFVIDPGVARISRYSVRTKVQRLPIEPISQASANQRAGRCGRISAGVCIRLYSEEDFNNRPEFTDAEILRTNLASVVLQMLTMGMGDIHRFPFVDPPQTKLIKDGFKLLEELQAVNAKGQLTALGKKMSTLPVDPKLGRMLLAAGELGALHEVLIIVAALSIQDPRERPTEKQQQADEKHRRFWDDHSDFVSVVNLWHYVEEQRQNSSQNQWRKQCIKEFLNFLRLREWRELHHQMRLAIKQLKLKENTEPANYEAIHRALLTGLITNVAIKSEEKSDFGYLGTRNRKLSIFPGSSQSKKKPKWIMAAEMLETSKLFAHKVAKIEPAWVLSAASHMVKHHYYEPYYQAKSGQVMGFDRMTLLGLVLADKQRVNYSQVDPKLAREVFIRSALVEGAYKSARPRPGLFFMNNQKAIKEVELLEAKSRRRDILINEEAFFQFYDERIPDNVVNLSGFEHWRKGAEQNQPDLLVMHKSWLMQHAAVDISEAQFPNSLTVDGIELPLFYRFDPGHQADGVSIGIPVSVLHIVPPARLEWMVPGLLREKCIALIKGLPKQWRKKFVPVPEFADKALARLSPSNTSLTQALSEQLQRLIGQALPEDLWQDVVLDDYYRLNIQVLDDKNKVLEAGRDLDVLKQKYKEKVQDTLQQAGKDVEREQVTTWDFGDWQKETFFKKGNAKIKAYPALVKEKDGIALRVLDNPIEAEVNTRKGMVALAAKRLNTQIKYLQKNILRNKDIALSVVNMGSRAEVAEDLIQATILEGCFDVNELPQTADAFAQCCARSSELVGIANDYETVLADCLKQVVAIKKLMKTNKNALMLAFCFADINEQLGALFYKGVLYDTPLSQFKQYPRYLKAITQRLEKAPMNVQKDKLAMNVLNDCWQKHKERLEKEGMAAYAKNQHWQAYRWMVEELRVSLFAQTLKTQIPVSEKRLSKAWQETL